MSDTTVERVGGKTRIRATAQNEKFLARKALELVNESLDTLTNDWPALTTGQKVDAVRDAMILALRICKELGKREFRR